ncbi:MAG: hypothetical protein MUE46_08665 [Xanthomonadales bacterium]|jgi:hypothetical protein|nr:hypothetical protein [Xanthomonadales bacterium]
MQSKRRRILIQSHEFSTAHLQALAREGFEVVALVQGRLDGLEHVSLRELYQGSARLREYAAQVPAPPPLPDHFVREYGRCISRVGFLPNGDYFTHAGGEILLGDVEDWAALHWRYAAGLLRAWSIDEVWFWWAPHLGVDQALWQAAQDLGVPCMSLRQLPFVNKFTAIGARHGVSYRLLPHAAEAWTAGARKPDLFYMRPAPRRPRHAALLERGRALLAKGFTQAGRADLLTRAYIGAVRRRWWRWIAVIEALDPALRPFARLRRWQRQEWQRGRADRRMVDPGQIREPYVYFALHLEPELNADVYGGTFAKQLDALGRIVARLPPGWRLLVKENPKQMFLKRSWAFFERSRLLQRMDFVPDNANSAALVEGAAVVASLCGTVIYEAMLQGKCGVYFGEPWYAGLPGAIRWSEDVDLEAVASQRVDRTLLDQAVNRWLSACPDGIVAPRFDALLPDRGNWQSRATVTAASLRQLSDALVQGELADSTRRQ